MGKEEAVKGNAQLYIYYCEHQHVCNILIMGTYVMTLKLVYLNMDCETFKDCWVCFFFSPNDNPSKNYGKSFYFI